MHVDQSRDQELATPVHALCAVRNLITAPDRGDAAIVDDDGARPGHAVLPCVDNRDIGNRDRMLCRQRRFAGRRPMRQGKGDHQLRSAQKPSMPERAGWPSFHIVQDIPHGLVKFLAALQHRDDRLFALFARFGFFAVCRR
jgi:hypothetical protein